MRSRGDAAAPPPSRYTSESGPSPGLMPMPVCERSSQVESDWSTSKAKVRLSRVAQSRRYRARVGCFFGGDVCAAGGAAGVWFADMSSRGGEVGEGTACSDAEAGVGTLRPRYWLFGPKTPWKRVQCERGGGTRAACIRRPLPGFFLAARSAPMPLAYGGGKLCGGGAGFWGWA